MTSHLSKLISILVAVSLLLGFAACESKKEDSGKKEEKKEEAAPESKKETITLEKLDGLKIDVAEGTTPSEMGGSVMIISMEESLDVKAASDLDPKSLEDAKKEATDTYQAKELVEEKLDDGWALSFQNTGSMGDNFFTWVRRTIDGKDYFCQTSVAHKTLRDGALTACKSLKK